MTASLSRRQFLKKSAAAGIAAAAFPSAVRPRSFNSRLQHASIGTGGMGWGDLNAIASHGEVEIVAICDVDQRRMAAAVEKFPEARRYQDWRELFAEEGDRIDTVNVTTPDHMHAPITQTALALGKHVYCQKPLTHDIYEARRITAAAKKAKVVTQLGTQLVSTIPERQAVHLVRTGVIGKVKEVFLWSNKDPWKYRPTGPRPDKTDPVPDGLNWDWWCGTAPVRPFVLDTYHPTWWRGWQDFGCGWLGDMGCHIMDASFRALGLSLPLSVRAEVEPEWRDDPARRGETFPTWQIVRYTYPGTKLTAGKTIEITWSDGSKYPPPEKEKLLEGGKFPTQGALLVGEEGTLLHTHGGAVELFPREKYKALALPELPPQNHYHQFVDAVLGKDGGRTESPFAHGGPLTEMVLAGTVALRFPSQALEWDASKIKVTNLPEANRFVRRSYRKGWEVEGL